ncbi:MAG: serine hydrolase domain-containing protein [Acidobacteriota bacterium]
MGELNQAGSGRRRIRVAAFLLVAGAGWCARLASGEAAPAATPALVTAHVPNPAADLLPAPVLPLLPADRSPLGAYATQAATLEQAIDQCVQADMTANRTPGAAVAVAIDGNLLYQHGYGVKHRRNGGAVDASTVFRIGSITKQMTAAAVMQQVEAGRVNLDDPLTQFVPELELAGRWPASAITVRHLLTHTAAYPDNLTSISGPTGDDALSKWVATQTQVRLHAPPGSFWNYSNPNFVLAGLVAERASGIPYRQYMPAQVWGPAGMTATTLSPADAMAGGNYSFGHYENPYTGAEVIAAPDSYDNGSVAPAGWAFSTAPDLVRWALLLTDGGGAVLTPASAEQMEQPQVSLGYTPGLFYGYGIMVEDYKGLDLRQHGGSLAGWGAMLIWERERRFAVALLANTTTALTRAAYCVVDAVLQPANVPPPDYHTDPATWRPYAGSYLFTDSFGTTFRARVELAQRQLFVNFSELPPPQTTYRTPLVQLYLDTFLLDGNADGELDMDVTFIRSGAASAPPRWLRNRNAVGERLGTTRPRLHAAPIPAI